MGADQQHADLPHRRRDDDLEPEMVEQMATQGDQDAMMVMGFEKDLEWFQDVRADRLPGRSTVVSGGRCKGRGKGKPSGKGFGKDSLLSRIARTNCKICGERGHWQAECPNKPKENPTLMTDQPARCRTSSRKTLRTRTGVKAKGNPGGTLRHPFNRNFLTTSAVAITNSDSSHSYEILVAH